MADDDSAPIIPDAPTGPFPKLTAATENPRSSKDYSGKDEWVTRGVLPYVYVDMRNQQWICWWLGQGWVAKPSPAAAEFYGLKPGNTYAGADDARGLIQMVEANIERDRIAKRDAGGFPWWLVIIAIVVLSDKKGRR
jgi:hypothetical protein